MNKEEITLEQAEDIVDNMYQNRFKECNVDNGNEVNIKNLDKIIFNDLEKASILLLRTEISQKYKLDKYKIVLDKIKETINYYAIENEDYSKIYNQEEQEIMKLLEEIE